MKPISIAIAAVLLGFAWPASSAWAALVRNTFAGVVTANNPLNGTPAIGSAFSGQFTIDSAVLAGEGPNCAGRTFCWSGPDTSWSWNTNNYALGTTTPAIAYGIFYTRVDSAPGLGADRLTVQLGGNFLTDVSLILEDPSGGAFEAGGFGLFTQRTFRYAPICVTGIGCALNPFYSGNLTSLVTTPVPEPGTAPMLLLGAAALAAVWRRQRV
jgi:PEP-CTERM motif